MSHILLFPLLGYDRFGGYPENSFSGYDRTFGPGGGFLYSHREPVSDEKEGL